MAILSSLHLRASTPHQRAVVVAVDVAAAAAGDFGEALHADETLFGYRRADFAHQVVAPPRWV